MFLPNVQYDFYLKQAVDPQLVSIIIPAHNAGRYIGDTIRSALAQTYPHFEIIVVDDGSEDGTPEIVENFCANHPRIKLLRLQRSGVAAARNAGIRVSRGGFIAPLDADDLWYPEKIACQVEKMDSSGPEVGLVYAWNAVIDSSANLLGPGSLATHEGWVFNQLLMSNFVDSASTPLIRRVCFERCGGYCSEFFDRQSQGCEDFDLYLRISEKFKFSLVRKILVEYRETPGAMSRNHSRMHASYKFVIERMRRRNPSVPRTLFGISEANFMFYLDRISEKQGNFLNCALYLAKAGLSMP